jgi:hypothetical protein
MEFEILKFVRAVSTGNGVVDVDELLMLTYSST